MVDDMPVPTRKAATMAIPGHGRLCDQADVVLYQEMVTILRDRIRDYDPVYGSTKGFWTTDMFVEAAYKSLGGK
jgi:hypothetical protein